MLSEDITTNDDTIELAADLHQQGWPGRVAPDTTTKTKVSIVGFADGHREDAPWDDPDMEFWGLNRLHTLPVLSEKRFDRWFEIHDLDKFYKDDEQHRLFLQQFDGPVYIRKADLGTALEWELDTAVPYPQEEMVNLFGSYFTNSVAWLMALAIAMGFAEIHLYGVDMAQDTVAHAEYREQRPSCEWLLGVAQGMGRRVVIPSGSDLLKASHLYGFDSSEYRQKLMSRLQFLGTRKEEVRVEMTQAQQRATWLQARISELDGAMQEVQYNLKNLVTHTEET